MAVSSRVRLGCAVVLFSLSCLSVRGIAEKPNDNGMDRFRPNENGVNHFNQRDNLIKNNKLLPLVKGPNRMNQLRNQAPANLGRQESGPVGESNGVPRVKQEGERRRHIVKISESSECENDVRRYCSKSHLNNFDILDCLQNDLKIGDEVSKGCQHFIWSYKRNLTKDERFEYAGKEVCKHELEMTPECRSIPRNSGQTVPCLIEYLDNITAGACKQFLLKMGSIIFSDYRLLYHFVNNCQPDIDKFKCGRLPENEEDSPHSQGNTIDCLKKNLLDLTLQCRLQVQRVAELQADDYHLDRKLYYSCRDDRERFCATIPAGDGRIFNCLAHHKFERDMSVACRQKLVLRQKMIAEDIKIEKGFYGACHDDIKRYQCGVGAKGGETFRRATVMLCLENAMKKDVVFSPECKVQVDDMRKSIMSDYQITPEIVVYCKREIIDYCKSGIKSEGETLHCLMEVIQHERKLRKKVSSKCKAELSDLLHEADVGEDFRIDRTLQKACQAVVDIACRHIQPGDASVLGCLMEKIGTDKMTDECETKLMEIQYFITRDFRLDARIYKYCHNDAERLCKAGKDWFSPHLGPSNAPTVLPCLYHHMKHVDPNPDLQVTKACKHEIHRVMRQRAVSVDLEPEIEEICMHDLSTSCSDKTGQGEEIQCLQDNYDHLSEACQDAIGNFTEDEDEDIELDVILIRACTPMIKRFCEEMMDNEMEPSEVMECLIEHKHHPNMNRKCSAGVEHHQLITLKDYRFNYKFKEACKKSVMKLCKNRKSKPEVVTCLSEHVRNDTLLDEKHRVDKECRRQLRVELLQRSESIDLDPELKKECEADVPKFCANKTPGNSQIIECLKQHQEKLSPSCHRMLFKREKVEMMDYKADYNLATTCKKMIKHYCNIIEPQYVLSCLKQHKDEEDFDSRCRDIIIRRQIMQNKDYRLNPQLRHACQMDIPKFCREVLQKKSNDKDLEGKVIGCLKKRFTQKILSRSCEEQIREIMKEAALDYRQDPVLAQDCHREIQTLCREESLDASKSDEVAEDGRGRVEECLKKKLMSGLVKNEQCKREIERLIQQSSADIHVDPILHTACQRDLKLYCDTVALGEGQQMSCLLNALEKKMRLSAECRKCLKQRKDMWEYAANVVPAETFNELITEMHGSPAKYYFLGVIITVIGFIFIAGLTCGRVSKRVRAELKNK